MGSGRNIAFNYPGHSRHPRSSFKLQLEPVKRRFFPFGMNFDFAGVKISRVTRNSELLGRFERKVTIPHALNAPAHKIVSRANHRLMF